jgi:hypothetical protein
MPRDYIKLPTKEIAKKIREVLKETMNQGKIPKGVKFSVTTDSNSIRLSIKEVPEDLLLFDIESAYFWPKKELYDLHMKSSSFVEKLFNALRKFDNQYNFDESDIQTDYFCVDHYFFPEIDHHLRDAQAEAIFNKYKDKIPVEQGYRGF